VGLGSTALSECSGIEWFVTDGRETVGPIPTQKLLRGYAQGIVTERCSVWQKEWSEWRSISAVREIATLRSARSERGEGWVPPPAWSPRVFERARISRSLSTLKRGSDVGEVLVLALAAAAGATGATAGLAHRPRKLLGGLEARGAVGAGAWSLLGQKIDATDPAIVAARLGAKILRLPLRSSAGRATSSRLASRAPLRGVVLAPIYAHQRLAAVLELGHADHAFRESDLDVIRGVVSAAGAEMSRR
jgi:hypothetical protein